MIGANAIAGRFCWVDLAASDAGRARRFYGELLGWTHLEEHVNGGTFTRLRLSGQDVGSLYQLSATDLDLQVPSHWMPYIRVDHLDSIVGRVVAIGGTVLVPPVLICGIARIALIRDAVGALVGLWEPIEVDPQRNPHG